MADAAGIQFRMLNASKGPAVRGPRAQMDRRLYKAEMQAQLAGMLNLEIVDGAVVDLILDHRPPHSAVLDGADASSSSSGARPAVAGVVLSSGEHIQCSAVVVTTGTFLGGVIHVGSQTRRAGRIASLASAKGAAGGDGGIDGSAAGAAAAEATDRADETAAGAATLLAKTFAGLGFRLGRLKTGTPPRLQGAGFLLLLVCCVTSK